MITTLAALVFATQIAAVPPPTSPVAPDEAPEVEVVLYSDFQCPFCARFAEPFRELQAKGVEGATLRIEFKHFPLSIHPAAQLAHQASLAAQEQGKFWEMHDLLFANITKVTRADLIGYAESLGLDTARFETDMDSPLAKDIVAADIADGNKAGVSGTPTYSINGKMHSGTRTRAQLEEIIVGERRRARALAEVHDTSMSKGPVTARVTLELFMDLQSPVSAPTLHVVNELLDRYPSDVKLQFRNFPLAFHPQAGLAHEAAMTAARHGQFWAFAAFILSHQDSLREQDLIAYAGHVGLDSTQFAATLREHRYAARVEADVTTGLNRGIRGSPSILVNGKKIDGVPSLQMLVAQVEAALAEKPAPQQQR